LYLKIAISDLFSSLHQSQIQFDYYLSSLDVLTWVLLGTCFFLLSFTISLHLRRIKSDVFFGLIAPVVETFFGIDGITKFKDLRVVFIIWSLGVMVLTNLFKGQLSNGMIMPLINFPLRTWEQLVNHGEFQIHSVIETSITSDPVFYASVSENKLRFHAPRNMFEGDLCSLINDNVFSGGECGLIIFEDPSQEFLQMEKINLVYFQLYSRSEISATNITKTESKLEAFIPKQLIPLEPKCEIYHGSYDIKAAETAISYCKNSVLVANKKTFKLLIDPVFPDRSVRRNLKYVKSLDALETSSIVVTYDKDFQPIFELVLSRASEQGMYNYWSTRAEHARFVAGNKLPQLQEFLPQGINSNLISVFILYSVLVAFSFIILFAENVAWYVLFPFWLFYKCSNSSQAQILRLWL